MKKQIGILGGMGPEATSELFSLIIKNTKAQNDQDHIPVLIVNNPKIPDRSLFILGKGPSPVNILVEGALKLEQMGADIILIPCNTAHFFIKQIEEKIHVPIIDMIKETARHVLCKFPEIKRYGLLSTAGVYKTAIYKKAFEGIALEIINPDTLYQKQNMTAIYGKNGIKAGFKTDPVKKLLQSVTNLEEKGVGAIVLGCTEISLVLKQPHISIPLINPLKILAEKSIQLAGYSCPDFLETK
ncbi:MAG: amino acid racemase [Bacteroidetes bacterium]|nr:amino acid racemase [Bacteroidota bacterium]